MEKKGNKVVRCSLYAKKIKNEKKMDGVFHCVTKFNKYTSL